MPLRIASAAFLRGPARAAAWKAAAVTALVAVSATTSGAQDSAGLPTLESLKPSSSPAFILLDAAPAQISRPNDPADVAASLVSGTNGFTALPRDFAMEFSPYWLRNRAQLPWREDLHRTISQSLARTFTVSAGSAQLGDSTQGRTGLAIGGRAQVLSGRVPREVAERLAARETELANISTRIDSLLRPAQDSLDAEKQRVLPGILASTPPERQGVVIDSLTRAFQLRKEASEARILGGPAFADIYKAMNALERAEVVREGPMLEVAAGLAWAFDDDVWKSGRLHRAGVWATYSCEKCRFLNDAPARITPMLLARWLIDADSSDAGIFDGGGRVALTGPHITGSVEGIRRTYLSGSQMDEWSVVGTLEYEFQRDTWIVASFGRDSNAAPERGLVARFGLKLNLLGDRYKER